jgi:hypothetical protein
MIGLVERAMLAANAVSAGKAYPRGNSSGSNSRERHKSRQSETFCEAVK